LDLVDIVYANIRNADKAHHIPIAIYVFMPNEISASHGNAGCLLS